MGQQEIFKHVNDSIRKVASQGQASQTWEFICECHEIGCHTLVSLTLSEFDARRKASPPQPVLALEHHALTSAGSYRGAEDALEVAREIAE
jgi:hypothetical protein